VAALAAEDQPFDIYLIDGRYRVACALASFLHASSHGADTMSIRVAVHDSHEEERGYSVLNQVASSVNQTKKIRLYRLRNTTSEQELFELWEKYQDVDG